MERKGKWSGGWIDVDKVGVRRIGWEEIEALRGVCRNRMKWKN